MLVNLKDMAYPDELELFKMIISSADRFPGLYRISSTWQQALHQDHYVKLLKFLEICHLSQKGSYWHRDEWFKAHQHVFNLAYGKNSRNEQRQDHELKGFLKEKGFDWFTRPTSFALAAIDNVTPVTEIEKEKSYYVMGSLIRFHEKSVSISYDSYSKKSGLELSVSFDTARSYIAQTFSEKSLSDLFLQAEILAHLDFDDEGEGKLLFHPEDMNNWIMRFPGNCPLFASVNYDETLPIRFAKLIGVSDVLR